MSDAPPPPDCESESSDLEEEVAEVVAVEVEDADLLGAQRGPGLFQPPAATEFSGKPPNRFIRTWRRIGGGSLTLSLLIHGGLLLVAGIVVVSQQIIEEEVDFLPGGGTQQGAEASSELRHQVQQKKRSTLNRALPMKKIVSTSENAALSLPEAPPDLLDVPDMSSSFGGSALGGALGSGGFGTAGAGGGFGDGMGIGGASGFVSLPPTMRSRCSAAERLKKLADNGGSSECERAVSQSLEWLASQQNDDGSWGRSGGKRDKGAMTGLALLCFLGRCETPDSPFYGDTVMDAILYLIELQQKNPNGLFSEATTGNAPAYEHGIATYALGEMYTLARLGSKQLPGMREAFERGVKIIIDNQTEAGSWVYDTDKGVYDPVGREDLSVTGWQFQALKAAVNTGLKIPGLHSTIDKTVDYLLSKQTEDGGFGREDRDEHYNQWSLTGCGVLGLQTLSKGKSKAIREGMTFLRDFLTKEPLDWEKNCNLYCWYYYTQAFFQQGGEDWEFYNAQFLPQMLANQNPDGSWKRGRPNWPSGDASDPIYRQVLCTLMLEVYYRYLKVADREEESFFDR